jgi:hypothetical protein
VLDYVSSTDSVEDENIQLISDLAVAVNVILKSNPGLLDGMLDKIFRFHMEGIELIQSGRLCGVHSSRFLRKIESNLNSYAGFIADQQYLNTEETWWLTMKYQCYFTSAEMSVKTNPRHSMHAYNMAHNASHAVYNTFEDSDFDDRTLWCGRWYESSKRSAVMGEGIDPRHAARMSSFFASAAHSMYVLTRNKVWAKRAVRGYTKFLDYFSTNLEPRMCNVMNRVETKKNWIEAFV